MSSHDLAGVDLRAMAAHLLERSDTPGTAIALVVDGRTVLTAGIGWRDLDRSQPLGDEAAFSLYSITKVFLAVAVLRLVELGRLSLDAPICSVLPEVALPEAVTIRRLLDHTSGLPDYGAMPDYGRDLRANPGAPWTPAEFFERTLRQGLLFPPGEGWAYSNIGYLLVRQAIERITQGPLRDALADLVFQPAGLRQTFVAESLADVQGLTPGYSAQLDQDGRLRDVTRRYHPGWVSHGAAVSTAADLARAFEALLGGRLLQPASLATMLDAAPVPAAHPLFVRPGYGLGVMVDLGSPFGRVAGHAGGGPGYSAAAFHFPDVAGRRLTSVALANRDATDLGMQIAFALATGYAERVDPMFRG